MKKNSRRNFIKKSSIIGSGIFIVPRNVLGGNGYISPSDQMLIASIGSGGKGGDIRDKWASKERVVALCDVHPDGSHGVIKSRKKYPNANIIIEGYASSDGSDAYNLKLSNKRAAAVKAYLVSNGIDAKRLNTVGYGETNLSGDNNTAKGRAESRRAKINRSAKVKIN